MRFASLLSSPFNFSVRIQVAISFSGAHVVTKSFLILHCPFALSHSSMVLHTLFFPFFPPAKSLFRTRLLLRIPCTFLCSRLPVFYTFITVKYQSLKANDRQKSSIQNIYQNRENNPREKWAKYMSRQFIEEKIWLVNNNIFLHIFYREPFTLCTRGFVQEYLILQC